MTIEPKRGQLGEELKMKVSITDKKVTTGKFRVSFPNLAEPKGFNGGTPKYGLTMLFPKDADLSALKKAAENAKIERWGADKSKWPTKRLPNGKVVSALRTPFRDGDLEKPETPGYAGQIFIAASSKADNQPGTIGRDKNRIDPKDIYAGCYARATLIAFAYPREGEKGFGNSGVSFALQNVQKWAEGPKFSGKKDAEDDFDAIEDDSDNPESYESNEENLDDAAGF